MLEKSSAGSCPNNGRDICQELKPSHYKLEWPEAVDLTSVTLHCIKTHSHLYKMKISIKVVETIIYEMVLL